MREIMELENVYKHYGDEKSGFFALDGINLKLYEGEFVCIMGPSGSGKSTLLNMIATIDKPSKGHVLIDKKRVTTMPEDDVSRFRSENIAMIYQDCKLIDGITIKENIMVPLVIRGVEEKEAENRLKEVAKKSNVEDILDKYPNECSGGQRQRAAVARGIIARPKMIIADEPTGALDTKNSCDILNVFRKMNKDDGMAIAMVTHDAFVASYCDKLFIIKDGKIDQVILRDNKKQIDFYNEILSITENELGGLFSI